MGKENKIRLRDCLAITGYMFSVFFVGAGVLANSLQDFFGWRYGASFLVALGCLVMAVNAGLWRYDGVRACILDSIPIVRR